MSARHVLFHGVMAFALTCVLTAAQAGVVLVAAENGGPIPQLTPREIRLLYLGHQVPDGNRHFTPLINRTREVTYEQFLQKVLFMTRANYRRRLVSSVYQSGGNRPQAYTDEQALIKALRMNKSAITFIDEEIARTTEGLRIIQSLW